MRSLRESPLAARTTLRLGGPARRLVETETDDEVVTAIVDADRAGERVLILGGGSNLVVADAGFDGVVVQIATRGQRAETRGDVVHIDVAAGEDWDAFVGHACDEGLRGLECLAGIPGRVGATPIQNVGAYGQEVRSVIAAVRVFDRRTGVVTTLPPESCGFAYRHSVFKTTDRYVVLGVTFALPRGGESAPVGYAELARALGIAEGERAPLAEVRRTVIALRRGKGMVLDDADPDSVSAGSFFVNPLLDDGGLAVFDARVAARFPGMRAPRFADPSGLHKVAAAWLIERAGFGKGYGEGAVGISAKHALALVHRGGGTTRELLALADRIRAGVHETFGIALAIEPVIVA